MMPFPAAIRSSRVAGLALILFAVAACADSNVVSPEAGPVPAPESSVQLLRCTANRAMQTVVCGEGASTSSGVQSTVIGGQGINVRLTSSNVTYSAFDSIFSFDVTVQNLLPEALGTSDGVTAHANGVRVFFESAPMVTSGSGNLSVENADGVDAFTSASQPYYQYNGVLATNEVSAPRTWQLRIDPTVNTFSFGVFVSTEAQPRIVINEIMANPGGTVQDSVGEYVELYNAGRLPVNLNGFSVKDNTAALSHTINADVIVPAGGYVLLGRSMNTSKNGGISPAYLYVENSTTTAFTFSNSGSDFFRIHTPSGITVDSVAYSSAATAAAAGVARELKSPGLDNTSVDGTNWASATSNYEISNKGTPGSANSN